jgi:hypothetical protein
LKDECGQAPTWVSEPNEVTVGDDRFVPEGSSPEVGKQGCVQAVQHDAQAKHRPSTVADIAGQPGGVQAS